MDSFDAPPVSEDRVFFPPRRSRLFSGPQHNRNINVLSTQGRSDMDSFGAVETTKRAQESRKRNNTTSAEHTVAWNNARICVAKAVASTLDTAADIAHEALYTGVDLLSLAPVPGLRAVGVILLQIWDALDLIEVNRIACLRLAERCGEILFSVRQEIHDAGDYVGKELDAPLGKLEGVFADVRALFLRQANLPFLKRYLGRNEIHESIAVCQAELRDALGMFSLSIQIRILREVQDSDRRRKEETRLLLEQLTAAGHSSVPPDKQASPKARPEIISHVISSGPSDLLPPDVLPTLTAIHTKQNSEDRSWDVADLREIMRKALQAGSDAEMLEILEIHRDEIPDATKSLQRALEAESEKKLARSSQTPPSAVGSDTKAIDVIPSREASEPSTKDTLDLEFLENGIECLQRLSKGSNTNLPNWTITKYELDTEKQLTKDEFSTVYRGRWHAGTVAVTVISVTTPRDLFLRTVQQWTKLRHSHVLTLCGASSAIGQPPWFFVTPFMEHGCIADFLRNVESQHPQAPATTPVEEINLLTFISDIAKGMEYLHCQGVLHGDLNGTNILVDGNVRCAVTDFGQSEMKRESYSLSGTKPHSKFLGWQAPELLAGREELTQAMDVYAFAICCVEILYMGSLPWGTVGEDNLKSMVADNVRPSFPQNSRYNTPELQAIIIKCWNMDPERRPNFQKVMADLRSLNANPVVMDTPASRHLPELEQDHPLGPSPDMRAIGLPAEVDPSGMVPPSSYGFSTNQNWIMTATDNALIPTIADQTNLGIHDAPGATLEPVNPEIAKHSSLISSDLISESSRATIATAGGADSASPPPIYDIAAERRNERRYRLLLTHDYHPSLTLPLWSPSSIELGAIGYLSKPSGSFVTLFNAFSPHMASETAIKNISPVNAFGDVKTGSMRQDRKASKKRGIQSFIARVRSRDNTVVKRRYSFALRAGHKAAYMCLETSDYRYVEELSAPKLWLKTNIEIIMEVYGVEHNIQKEDLYFVIGSLYVPTYALLVSHSHPDSQVHFNVFSSPKPGTPWGSFTTEVATSFTREGPSYKESLDSTPVFADKVSNCDDPWKAVLLARLRFKPDALEPTSL